MNIKTYLLTGATFCAMNLRAQTDTLQLDLPATIMMVQRQSPSVQSARNTFLSAHWAYRYHRANYLPSLSLTSSPYLNKTVNKITLSDGTANFIKQDQLGADLAMKISQNIALTGGSLFVKSSLNRLDELRNKTTAYGSAPFVVGYEYQRQKVVLQMQYLKHDSVATRLKLEMIAANRTEADKKLLRVEGRTSKLVVRAPVSGQLSYVGVTQGQQVTSGASIGQIKVMSQFKLQVALAEYYIDRVTTGLPAHIEYEGRRYPLRVSKVVPEVKDHKFVCELTFANDTPSNIRLGKSYRVLLELGKPEQALVIPNGDFLQTTNGYWIFRVSADGKKAKRVGITVGRQNPQQCEITSGLAAGDKVVVCGYSEIANTEEFEF